MLWDLGICVILVSYTAKGAGRSGVLKYSTVQVRRLYSVEHNFMSSQVWEGTGLAESFNSASLGLWCTVPFEHTVTRGETCRFLTRLFKAWLVKGSWCRMILDSWLSKCIKEGWVEP